jgi:hypothetical protein
MSISGIYSLMFGDHSRWDLNADLLGFPMQENQPFSMH